MTARCPVCDVILLAQRHEHVPVLWCPSCSGVFIEHMLLAKAAREEVEPRTPEERAAAVAAAGVGIPEHELQEERPCPVCARRMRVTVYAYSSGVLVDECRDHGIWLDAGELHRIEAWAEAERRGEARLPTVERTLPAGEPLDAHDPFHSVHLAHAALDDLDLIDLPVAGSLSLHAAVQLSQWAMGQSSRNNMAAHGVEASAAIARAQADADAVPGPEHGAISCSASADVVGSIDVVWTRIAVVDRYPSWMGGVEQARVLEGAGSGRTQELMFAGAHRVVQRVTRLDPDRQLVARTEREWLNGYEVPAWHAGAWTSIRMHRETEHPRVEIEMTHLAVDDEQRRRVQERLPALQTWLEESVVRLARS